MRQQSEQSDTLLLVHAMSSRVSHDVTPISTYAKIALTDWLV